MRKNLILAQLILVAARLSDVVVARGGPTVPSCEQIKSMKIAINHMFGPNGNVDLVPTIVRFAFHSCVGGCNGCINLDQAPNAGLEEALTALEDKYSKLGLADQGISRADFWAFAGMVAVEKGASLQDGVAHPEKPCFHYQWGRKDCPTSPSTDAEYEFPGGHLTREQMFNYFDRNFNFDESETVTILGAHSLGEAVPENSGYDGEWTPGQVDVFNTTYYENMLDPTLYWENKNAGNKGGVPHWQWEAVGDDNETYFMLNTDFEIFFDLDLDANGKAACELDVTCVEKGTCGKHGVCPKASTYELGKNYIDNPHFFFTDFNSVYAKMLHTGTSSHLERRGSSCQFCTEPVDPPSCGLIDKMKKALLDLYTPDGNDYQHAALRLAFHFCVGGCHGCLNLDQGDNAGLAEIVAALEKIYADLDLAKKGVSRADFWALAGTVSVEVGAKLHRGSPVHKPCFEYYWGRKDCHSAPSTDVVFDFPAPWMTSHQMFSYFKRMFHFSKEEVVTIMGAHAIGEAEKDNSGFDGYWALGQESVFNVTYYQNLIDPNTYWVNENVGEKNGRQHWQWKAVDPAVGELPHQHEQDFMLNTDFELLFDLELDGDGKAVCDLDTNCVAKGTCGKNGICGKASTYDQALAYSKSNDAFYEDFTETFTKMIATGNRDLSVQGGTCHHCNKH